jgi:hypothetical protein
MRNEIKRLIVDVSVFDNGSLPRGKVKIVLVTFENGDVMIGGY